MYVYRKFLAVELWNQKYTRGLCDHSPLTRD